MNNCEKCKFRAKYDHNPQSLMGRIWKWHIGWCPGWKSYVKSLPDERRMQILEEYTPTLHKKDGENLTKRYGL